jgi:hypothetical protein
MKAIVRIASEKKWQDLVREQQRSKLSVSAFCRERDLCAQSFYTWRKRLAVNGNNEAVRFALVDANRPETVRHAPMELILASGDRLRIGSGTDAATLRAVLTVLRER